MQTSDEPANVQPNGISRRRLFRFAGGAAVAAAAAGGGMQLLRPFSSGRVEADAHLAQITEGRYMFLGGTDGWMGLPATPAIPIFHPDPMGADKGIGLNCYIFGFRNITELDQPQRVGAEGAGAALGAAVLGRPVQPGRHLDRVRHRHHEPRARRPTRPVRRPHPALARLPQRDPVLRRRADGFGVGAGRHGVPVRLPAPRPRHLHVPLPRRGHRARAHGDERHHVRPADPERQHDTPPERQVPVQRRRRVAPATTGNSPCTCRRCGPSRTGPTPTSSCPSGPTTTSTSPC